MSLNMYLGETDTQTNSMDSVCIEIIQSMEKTMSSIASFSLAISLQGKTYDSAKAFMAQTYFPLAQGIIYLCEELIRQNSTYPSDFRSKVATTDVIEREIMEQIQEIERMIANLQQLNEMQSLFTLTIYIYQTMKRKLEEKLTDLYAYNSSSASNYKTAMQLAQNVMTGLSQVQGGKNFNSKSGTFSIEGIDLSWVANLDEIHYTRKAKDKYGDYLDTYPDDIEKVITILKYEERQPEYTKDTNEFLSPLEQKDTVEIKFLMYNAEEPYRTLALKYLDELTIADIDGDGAFFRSSENSITFNVGEDRMNDRGAYLTFFHELGHAIDYNYGVERGMNDFYSNVHTSDGKTLAENMHGDVEDRIRTDLANELNKPDYDSMNDKVKTEMIDTISKAFIHTGASSDVDLTSAEEDIYEIIQADLSGQLQRDEHHNVSDVYGGVTINEIVGKWGHHSADYWIDEKTRERTNEPNKEGFASYYGSIMLQDGDYRDQQLESVNEYLPHSKQHMDEMFDQINEGERE